MNPFGADRSESDSLTGHDRRQVNLDRIGLAPTHRDPRITGNEPIVFLVVDHHDIGFAFNGIADFIGSDSAAQAGPQNDDTRQRHDSLSVQAAWESGFNGGLL